MAIGLLYLVATLININKAYHIDDTFHLEAGNWIKHHPLTPMSGLINWDENKEPMYVANQPPLYFYFVALVSTLFGNGEIVMHLFQSIFTLFALLVFYKITQLLQLKHGLLLTAFLAVCPAFLVNQNLMIDVPLLSISLWFLYYLLLKNPPSETRRYWKASLVLSLSLLIKYTNIPLLTVLLITLLWRRQFRLLYIVLVPIGVLGLWSVWNYVEFGGIHIVNRPRNPMTMERFTQNVVDFITCLGAISPFTFAFGAGYFSRFKISNFIVPTIAFLFVGLTIATDKNRIFILTSNDILSTAFLLNGLLLIVFVLASIWRHNFAANRTIDTADIILLTWILAVSGFIILFAPFIASRHVLLIMPPVLFLGGRWLDSISIFNASQAILLALGLGVMLAISDWRYADFYRKKAQEAADALPPHTRTWTTGHWGWQWYGQQNGFKEVQADSMQFQPGDYLVKPVGVDSQEMPKGVQLEQTAFFTAPPSRWTFLSTSFYNCFYGHGTTWAYSKLPIDTIKVYKITSVPVKHGQLSKSDSLGRRAL
ncbi:hypothetical protein GCM10028773_59380 [Spirosoma koreense]